MWAQKCGISLCYGQMLRNSLWRMLRNNLFCHLTTTLVYLLTAFAQKNIDDEICLNDKLLLNLLLIWWNILFLRFFFVTVLSECLKMLRHNKNTTLNDFFLSPHAQLESLLMSCSKAVLLIITAGHVMTSQSKNPIYLSKSELQTLLMFKISFSHSKHPV